MWSITYNIRIGCVFKAWILTGTLETQGVQSSISEVWNCPMITGNFICKLHFTYNKKKQKNTIHFILNWKGVNYPL